MFGPLRFFTFFGPEGARFFDLFSPGGAIARQLSSTSEARVRLEVAELTWDCEMGNVEIVALR